MKQAKAAGTRREHDVAKDLEADDWAVTRGAGSHGCADLWAAKAELNLSKLESDKPHYITKLWLLQIKANVGSPWKNFQPAERIRLRELAAQTGGEAWLVHHPPHGKCRWYSASEWPKNKETP